MKCKQERTTYIVCFNIKNVFNTIWQMGLIAKIKGNNITTSTDRRVKAGASQGSSLTLIIL